MVPARAEIQALAGGAWWRRHLLWPLAVWVLVVALGSLTDLDRLAMEPWATPQGFPLRGSFLWSVVLHKGLRKVVAGLAVALFVAALVARRARPGAAWPASAIAVVLSLALTSLTVAVLKDLTDHPCPWDDSEWGGRVVRGLADPGRAPIRGWPAAHASVGFGWLGLYFAARWHGRPRPGLWLLPGLLLGLVCATTQHVRGAHFPSHNAWTLLIAWVSAILVHAARAFLTRRQGGHPQGSGPAGGGESCALGT